MVARPDSLRFYVDESTLGLGKALVRQAMIGFRASGLRRVYLEVTAENLAAVLMYRDAGFRRAKTLYKAVDG